MFSQFSIKTRYVGPVAAAVALLLSIVAVPMARADTTGDVTVTASITNQELSLTLCDTEANFGTDLNSHGAAPQYTTDTIAVTTEGTGAGEGVFYKWTPSCAGSGLVTVQSNIPWNYGFCAGPNTGTNADLSNQNLRWSNENLPAYGDLFAPWVAPFPTCPGGSLGPTNGSFSFVGYYYLQIDDNVGNGTFETVTTWTVTPA